MKRLKGFIEVNKGVTLIEMLVAISIIGVVLALATNMIIPAFNIVPSGTRRMSARQMAELHLTEISRYVRNDEIDSVVYNGDMLRIELKNNEEKTFNNVIEDESNIPKDPGNNVEIKLTVKHDNEYATVKTVVTPRN